MSVASKNPFALLNDYEEEADKSAPAASQPAKADAPKPNRKPTTTRGGRYYQRGGPKPVVTSPPPAEDNPAPRKNYRDDRGDRPPRDRGERGERGERGRGGRGRGGRGRGGDRDARPDRHSATGIVDSQKKVHQGWGGDRGDTEYRDETNGAKDASAEEKWGATTGGTEGWDAGAGATGEADPWAEPAGEGENKGDAKPSGDEEGQKKKRYDEEEDEGKMTLDEYLAKKTEGSDLPKLEPRKADDSSSYFKDAVQITKDADANNYFVGKQAKTSAPRTRKEGKQYIEIEARFDPPARGRGRGRGGRGDYRGGGGGGEYRGGGGGGGGEYRGGGRGGGRYQQNQSASLNVNDQAAFPSL